MLLERHPALLAAFRVVSGGSGRVELEALLAFDLAHRISLAR